MSIQSAIEELTPQFGDRLSTAQAILEQHGKDESYHPTHAPDAVAFAQSTEEVAEIVKICAAHKRPVIPFGTGTSLEGHVAALHGGISIDLTQMDQVLEVNQADRFIWMTSGSTYLIPFYMKPYFWSRLWIQMWHLLIWTMISPIYCL